MDVFNTHPEAYDELRRWIDTGVIAEAILSALWEEGLPLTRTQAKDLWYRALEELPELLSKKAQSEGQAGLSAEEQQPGSDEESGEDVPF